MPRLRLAAERQFGNDNALPLQCLMEAAIFFRIDDIDAAGDDPRGAGVERAQMRAGVDAAGEPGDDDEPALSEPGGEFAGEAAAVGGRVARADDRDHRPRQQLDRAEHAQYRRRVFDFAQGPRITRFAPAQ
jgi:hypothetical protein